MPPAARRRRNSLSRLPAPSLISARSSAWYRPRRRAPLHIFPPRRRSGPIPHHREVPRHPRIPGRGSRRPVRLSPMPVFVAAETAWRMMTKRDPHGAIRSRSGTAAGEIAGIDGLDPDHHRPDLGIDDEDGRPGLPLDDGPLGHDDHTDVFGCLRPHLRVLAGKQNPRRGSGPPPSSGTCRWWSRLDRP